MERAEAPPPAARIVERVARRRLDTEALIGAALCRARAAGDTVSLG